MTQNDKNMIAGLPFEAAAKEIGAVITGLQVINDMAEGRDARNLAEEALPYMEAAEANISKAQSVMQGIMPPEKTITETFLKLHQDLKEAQDMIAFEFTCTSEPEALADLDQAKELLEDAFKIVDRAEARADNIYKGSLQPRIVLTAMAEYFTADATTSTLRYCHIPEEYRK